ncbi:MAG: protein translocase subunit SecDF [Flavobacteriales bacterium]|nr:protein translocase subunit SecDF [Flavobacteriales bacterium]
MENKNAVLIFTVLLAFATLYTLSFNWASKRFEAKASIHGQYIADSLQENNLLGSLTLEEAEKKATREYLRDSISSKAHPFGQTYREVKEQELNLGLDLQGGMSVTLEVSIPDLIISLSDYSENENFRSAIKNARLAQKNSSDGFMVLFDKAWNSQTATSENPTELWRIFHNMEQKDLFPPKSTDAEIMDILFNEAETAIDNTENIIRKRIDQLGVAQPNVQKLQNGRILVELPGIDDRERARKQLKSTANLEFWETYFNDEVIGRISAANAAVGEVLNPELFGDEAPADSTLTQNQLQLKNPLFATFQMELGRRSAIVGYAQVSDTNRVNDVLNRPEALEALGANLRLLWDAKSIGNIATLYAIKDESGKGRADLTGSSIVDARVSYDEIGDVVVSMTMDSDGAKIWGKMTKKCSEENNRAVAVVLDNLVFSAPNVQSAITNGRSQISFGSQQTSEQKIVEAEDLSSLLKAGSLPAPARIVDEVSIGPQLGEDNIKAGMSSFIIALLVVFAYMIFYYSGAGVVSNIALLANLFFLIGALASLGAALTLPGIAGIVLTIGMAVDANVLIYERIREEMRHGKGLALAVKEGYSKAYSAIIDANFTTLLVALILYSFGSGSIRGFATTLIIGIFTSLFSAIVITRLVFFSRLDKGKNIRFASKTTENWFHSSAIDFIGKRKRMYVLSALVILGGLGSLASRGLNYGVEFTGGTTFDISFNDEIDTDDVRSALSTAFTEDGTPGNPMVQTKESDQKLRVMTNFMIESPSENVDEEINAALEAGLSTLNLTKDDDYSIDMYNKVATTISDDFRDGAKKATIFSLLIIFLYIVFRFRKWQYGLGALIATTHDVLIVLSVFSIFWGILPFTMEIDQAFIAAILTVIGYSINDTVVVFDRIREYVGLYSEKRDDRTLVNDALNSTLSRTVNTSLSTFVVLLTIFSFGGDNIKGFVFALMIGVVVGTYSSIFIATPSVLDLSKKLSK